MTVAARIIAWLAGGHLVIGALFWGLLHVPESTVWALALTAILGLLIVIFAAIVEAQAVLWWQTDPRSDSVAARNESLSPGGGRGHLSRVRAHLRRGRASALPSFVTDLPYARALGGFVLAALLFGLIYWITGRADTWWADHRGEIDAWLMMRIRSARTQGMHRLVDALIWIVRYPVALSLAVGLLGAWLRGALHPPLAWTRSALHWRPILGISLALLIFVVLPWQYVYWRPASLPTNWIELVFVGAKLSAIYVLINSGWAIVLSAGARSSGQ